MARIVLPSRVFLFGLVAIIAVAVIVYSQAVQRSYFGSEFEFVPVENALLVATGDIESLWKSMESHFGGVIREKERKGFLSSLVEALQRRLKENNKEETPINSLSDLNRYGLNTMRGAVLSLQLGEEGLSFVLILHVKQKDKFREFLTKLTSADKDNLKTGELRKSAAESYSVTSFGDDAFLVYPQTDLAVVSNSYELLKKSLFNRRRNLTYALKNDALYESVVRHLRRPPLSGPVFFAFYRGAFFSPLQEVSTVIGFEESIVRVDGDIKYSTSGIKLLDSLFKETPQQDIWWQYLSSDTAAAIVFQDNEMPLYLRLLSNNNQFGQAMKGHFEGVLWELRQVSVLYRLLLAVTGYRDGLPDMIMGVWGNPTEQRRIIDNLRIQLRKKRDQTVLTEALKAFREKEKQTEADAFPITRLIEQGLLQEEPYSTFGRYVITQGKVGDADLSQKDFQNAAYRRKYKDRTIEYLLPPVTANDLRYRFRSESLDRDALMSDRYRMGSIFENGILWIATDDRELEALVNRLQSKTDTLADNIRGRALSFGWNGKEKAQLFLNMDRITTLGFLSPESQIEELVKQYLLDLRQHPFAFINIHPNVVDGHDHLRVIGRVVQRSRWEGP